MDNKMFKKSKKKENLLIFQTNIVINNHDIPVLNEKCKCMIYFIYVI